MVNQSSQQSRLNYWKLLTSNESYSLTANGYLQFVQLKCVRKLKLGRVRCTDYTKSADKTSRNLNILNTYPKY